MATGILVFVTLNKNRGFQPIHICRIAQNIKCLVVDSMAVKSCKSLNIAIAYFPQFWNKRNRDSPKLFENDLVRDLPSKSKLC